MSVVSAAALAASSAAHRILVLHSDRLELPGSVRFDESLRSALAGGGPIDVYTESLDTARFPAPSDRQAQSAFLRRKYADKKPDLIISLGEPARDFVARYQARLFFPGTPMIAGGPRG